MTKSNYESDQIIADEILPVEIDEPAVPVELDTLQPWHRPRKQFIREHQWIYFARRLISSEKGSAGLPDPAEGLPEVRYLSLPGIDYLDVRMLAALCAEHECCLTNTGFLAGSERHRQVARAVDREESLIRAGHITRNSQTYNRRLEEIADRGQAYRELERRGPFHIVNIDVCGSIAAPTAQHSRRLIDAIYRIVEFQIADKTHGWLLFVTADVRHDSLATHTLSGLCKAIRQNAKEDPEFRREVLSLFDQNDADIATVVNDASGSTGDKFLKLFSLGFAKWLLHLAYQKNWDVKTHNTYCYSTQVQGKEAPTMACLAFEFLAPPPGLPDRLQVTRAEPAGGRQTENTSIRAAKKVSEMDNLDRRMQLCNDLRTELMVRTKELLFEAGYTESALTKLEELP